MDWTITKCAAAICRRTWFPLLWSFIGLVSMIDSYFAFRFRDLLRDLEENPAGRYLIELQNGQVSVFLRTKAAGTIAVLGILAAFYVYRHRWRVPIIGSVAAFQMGLLVYMTMSLPADSAPRRSLQEILTVSASDLAADAARVRPVAGHRPLTAHEER